MQVDLAIRQTFANRCSGFDSVHPFHADVHNDQFRADPLRTFDSTNTVICHRSIKFEKVEDLCQRSGPKEIKMYRSYAVTALVLVGLILPVGARASITYSFSSGVGSFSITNPTILTSNATLSFSPFTLDGDTFTFGSAIFAGNNVCFYFATSNTGQNCASNVIIVGTTFFDTGHFPERNISRHVLRKPFYSSIYRQRLFRVGWGELRRCH